MMENTSYTDTHIGELLRYFRKAAGMTQRDLAARLGVTFQQIQKYENGINRLSVIRLYEIALTLQIPVRMFFPSEENHMELPHSAFSVARHFAQIPNHRHRDALASLISALAAVE